MLIIVRRDDPQGPFNEKQRCCMQQPFSGVILTPARGILKLRVIPRSYGDERIIT